MEATAHEMSKVRLHFFSPSMIPCSSFGRVLKDLRHTISLLDVPPSNKFDSAEVDLHHLSGNDLLAACKFPMCALDAFRFCPIAEGGAMSVFWEIHM